MADGRVGRTPQYEAIAGAYEKHAQLQSWNALYDRPAMLDLIGDVAGRRVLDAGCGPGLYAEELLARGAGVVAFDHSPAMVALARRRAPGADVRVHDLRDELDWLDDESIDVVVSALVWHYVDDRLDALRSFARVLTSDGVLVISTHHAAADWVRLGGSYFAEEVIEERWTTSGWNMRYWRLPLTTLTEEFAAAGFVIERLVEPRPHADMATSDPTSYARLSTSPGFIMFRLRLSSAGQCAS